VLKVPKNNGLAGQAFKDREDKVQAVNLPVRSMPILLDSSYWYYFEHPLLAAANLKQPDEQGYETEFAFLIWNCPGHPDNKKMPNHAHTAYNEIVAESKYTSGKAIFSAGVVRTHSQRRKKSKRLGKMDC
jgi:hypothetical protein